MVFIRQFRWLKPQATWYKLDLVLEGLRERDSYAQLLCPYKCVNQIIFTEYTKVSFLYFTMLRE